MPLYTYRCNKCGEQFEALIFQNDPVPKCPECGSINTERDFSGIKGFNCPGFGGSGCTGSCKTCPGCKSH